MRIALTIATFLAAAALAAPAATGAGGRIAFFAADPTSWHSTIDVISPDGSGRVSLTSPGLYRQNPVWSPDGTRIAFDAEHDGVTDVFVMDADGGNVRQVTHDTAYHWSFQPTWSPDGTQLAFIHGLNGECCRTAVVGADGTQQHDITTGENAYDMYPAWSPDGSSITITRADAEGDAEIYAVAPDGSGLHQITNNPVGVSFGGAWSPDGSRLAFVAQRPDGSGQLDLVDADGSNLVELADGDGTAWDGRPTWSPDGSQLVFESMRDGSATTDLYVIATDGTGFSGLLRSDDTFEAAPAWGP